LVEKSASLQIAKKMSESALHVLFSPSAAATLKQALLMVGRPDEVLCSFDNFSFGPIATDDTDTRIRWVEENLGYTGWDEVADQSTAFLATFRTPKFPIAVWISRQETVSYAGFLWWLSHVGHFPVSIIEVEELSLTNAEDMIQFLDQATPLSAEFRMHCQNRWEQLKVENAPLRVIRGVELVSAQIEYFDDSLLSHATLKWQKMARIVAGTLVEFQHAGIYQTGDLVLGARLADLAQAGKLDWRGDLSNMQRCELRLPS